MMGRSVEGDKPWSIKIRRPEGLEDAMAEAAGNLQTSCITTSTPYLEVSC